MNTLKKFWYKNVLIRKTGLALDIDDTLTPTVSYILEKMHQELGNPDNLTVKQLVDKFGKYDTVHWKTPRVEKWLDDNINVTHLELPLLENVHHIVNKINQIIPIAAYITARPDYCKKQTKAWLKKHDFPLAPLIMQPAKYEQYISGSSWKSRVLESLYPKIVGIVDDSEHLVNNISSSYKGQIFLYDQTVVKRNDINVVACPTWDDVYAIIKKNQQKLERTLNEK